MITESRMVTDLVIPQRNEAELMEMAVRLGYECLVLGYQAKPEKRFSPPDGLDVLIASLDRPAPWANLTLARAKMESRGLLSQKEIHGVYNLEITSPKDFMHQRASGLNTVLCDIAARNHKLIILNFALILDHTGPDRATIMGRISQNIRLCRKSGAAMAIASMATNPYRMRSPHDLAALFSVLGMHPKEANDALAQLRSLIKG